MSVIKNPIADLAMILAEDYIANICKEDFLQAISHMSTEELEELFQHGYKAAFHTFCMKEALENAKKIKQG